MDIQPLNIIAGVCFASRCGVGYMPVLSHSSNTYLHFPSFLPCCMSHQPVFAGVLVSTGLMVNYALALLFASL